MGNLAPVWEGNAVFSPSQDGRTEFSLALTPFQATSPTEESVLWSELPPCLNVLDGGQVPLSREEIEKLLSDCIEFHNLVKAKVHTPAFTRNASFESQDGLLSLDEVHVVCEEPVQLGAAGGNVGVLELELFELTYFSAVIISQGDEEEGHPDLFLKLTQHWYRQQRREGRRVSASGFQIPEGRVLEISDFGLKLERSSDEPGIPGELVSLSLPNSPDPVRFRLIYSARSTWGLSIADWHPKARKAWQELLLLFQYPDLRMRTVKDHEPTWALLKKSGYFGDTDAGKVIELSKESVLREWKKIDEDGPATGIAVIARDAESPVATIGVTKAACGVWVAQTAAVIDDPKYLKFTRAMYGWRTRAILQQPDGDFHLAFFLKGKRFLDRFFRKFYLKLPPEERERVTWDEARYFAIWHGQAPHSSETLDASPSTAEDSAPFVPAQNRFVQSALRSNEGPTFVKVAGNSVILTGRPHIHVGQFLNSIWINDLADLSSSSVGNFGGSCTFSTLMADVRLSHKEIQKGIGDVGRLILGDVNVIWLCPRAFLIHFLANSLHSLEVMERKYGDRRAG